MSRTNKEIKEFLEQNNIFYKTVHDIDQDETILIDLKDLKDLNLSIQSFMEWIKQI